MPQLGPGKSWEEVDTTSSVEPLDTRDLIPRIANGDADALTELYRRCRGRVYALCLRMTNSAADAEDLTHEVFLRVSRSAAEFRNRAPAEAWVYRIARNLCIDHIREDARRRVASASMVSEPASSAPNPATVHRVALLQDALQRLPIEDREVVVLARCVGLGSGVLGDILECKPGAARVRLHRALARLRSIMVELEERSDEL